MKIYKVTNWCPGYKEERDAFFRTEGDAIDFAMEEYSSRYRGTFLAFNVKAYELSDSGDIRFRIIRSWIPDEEDEDNYTDDDIYDVTVVKEVEVK